MPPLVDGRIVCEHAGVCACMLVFTSAHTDTQAHTMSPQVYMYTYMHVSTDLHTNKQMYTPAPTCVAVRLYTWVHIYLHTYSAGTCTSRVRARARIRIHSCTWPWMVLCGTPFRPQLQEGRPSLCCQPRGDQPVQRPATAAHPREEAHVGH